MARCEAAIQAAVIGWLTREGILHVRVPLGAVIGRGASGGRHRRANPMRGFPDVMGVVPDGTGRLFVVEVKDPAGDFSVEQLRWRERLVAAGALYVCARQAGDVLAAIRSGNNILE